MDKIKKTLISKINEEKNNFKQLNTEAKYVYPYIKDKINTISLFSGCGGLDLGFELSGLYEDSDIYLLALINKETKYKKQRKKSLINFIYSNDIFKEARESHYVNFENKLVDDTDIRKIKAFPKADLVLGGFPCPGFSAGGPRLIDDKRNFLYIHFIRCILDSNPLFFVAENVKGMLTLGNGEVFKQIKEDFSSCGYNITYKLINTVKYGIPQLRERVIIIGVRNDLNFKYEFYPETHNLNYVTLKDVIYDLKNRNDLQIYNSGFSSQYMSRNRRKEWNEPSFTIQASGRHAPIHPDSSLMIKKEKDKFIFLNDKFRRLSVEEVARIQTFPDWFFFSGGNSNNNTNTIIDKKYKQIGNSVPVRLGLYIGIPIILYFKKLHS